MATISGLSSVCWICRATSHIPRPRPPLSSSFSSSLSIQLRAVHLQSHGSTVYGNPTSSAVVKKNNKFQRRRNIVRSVAEETLIPEEAEAEAEENNTNNPEEQEQEQVQVQEEASTTDQPVSVPVSPSDVLTMFFQAEGTMNETAIPTVTSALQEAEGLTNLKVQVVEGIASVELKKETTVQATGVASGLVEIIQGSGFKLQTLNLSFEDEEDIS